MAVPSIDEVHRTLTAPGSPFEIEDREIRGIRTRVWKQAPPTLRAVLELSRIHADKTFLVYEDERIAFNEHFEQCAWLSRLLTDRFGVRKGDRVAITMRNFPEWSVAFWAAASAGAVVVPLNSWWTGEELEYGLRDSGSSVLFTDAERNTRLVPHLEKLDDLRHVIVARADAPIPPEHLRFEEVVGSPATVDLPAISLEPEDDATIFYTSGTTGRPKGALGTHRNICTNLVSLAFGTARTALRGGQSPPSPSNGSPQSAQLISVPFFHATGCHSILCASLAFGSKLVMMYRWDPERALELIERERITSFGGVPAMVWQVLESPSFSKRDLSSVTNVGYGGAPAAPELVRRINEAFPGTVGGSAGQGYGLTETSAVTTLNGGKDYEQRPDSVGVPVPICDVKIVSEDGRDLPVGELGEIWIRGANVVKGYWNKPEATAEAITDGWLHSGDVGRRDDEGFVYIADRVKDMLIRGGENIYCVEVEDILYSHPAVMDAAVVGIPHRVLGEEVGAVVQIAPGRNVTQKELQDHVAAHLAAFKVPVRIDMRSEPLPRNPNGKILKNVLRDELAETGTS